MQSVLKKDISVIIPAYNEEKRVMNKMQKTVDYLKSSNRSFEIIVVDDGSTDNTYVFLSDFARNNPEVTIIKLPENRGKGFAVKTGMLSATGEHLIFMDADGATPPSEMEKLIDAIKNGVHIAIGSRVLRDSTTIVKSDIFRKLLRKILNLIVKLFLFSDIKDTQCGFKMFTCKAAKDIFNSQRLCGYGFDMEILYLAKQRGYKIAEVPISWKSVGGGKLNPFTDSLRILADIIKIKRKYSQR